MRRREGAGNDMTMTIEKMGKGVRKKQYKENYYINKIVYIYYYHFFASMAKG